MRVRMVTLAAGPLGIWRPGEVVEVDAATASTLLAAQAAVAVAEAPAVVEVATLDDAPGVERAVTRKKKRA